MSKEIVLEGVREYCEEYPVKLVDQDGRLCVEAVNEGGYNCTLVDVEDLIKALATTLEVKIIDGKLIGVEIVNV